MTRAALVSAAVASAGALVLVPGLLTVGALPASVANIVPTATASPTQAPPNTDGPATQTTWHNCSIVSGPTYVGGVCPGAGSEGKSVKQILGGDDVPVCWDDPVSQDQLDAMGYHNVSGPDGHTYYWTHCLSGIDPKTKVREPGGIHISTELNPIPNGTPPRTLTKNQRDLVDALADQGNVPAPVAAVSPSDHPRVGMDVAFFNASPGEFYVRPMGAVIHAYIDHTYIEPLGAGAAPKIDCPGNGTVAEPGQQRADGDGLCWYRYLHSSAGQANDAYDVRITSHWVVEIAATEAGPYDRIDGFMKSATTRIPVTEVQALVVH